MAAPWLTVQRASARPRSDEANGRLELLARDRGRSMVSTDREWLTGWTPVRDQAVRISPA
jgi:hypothetical protein